MPAATRPVPRNFEGDVPAERRRGGLMRAARVVHPFPTLLNVAATAALAFVASDGLPPAAPLAVMLAAMLLIQCAIGAANDAVDRELDARTKPWKPVPSGVVSARAASVLAAACGVGGLALSAVLGVDSMALAAVGLACGLSYDLWLKRTILSPIAFMLAIPVLPLWVWLSLDRWEPVLWWLLPLGALIGLSLHLANTAPDIESDALHGVRGFAHRLGTERALLAAWVSFALALTVAAVLAPFVDPKAGLYLLTLGLGLACAVASLAFILRRSDVALRIGFVTVALGSVAVAAGWLAAVT